MITSGLYWSIACSKLACLDWTLRQLSNRQRSTDFGLALGLTGGLKVNGASSSFEGCACVIGNSESGWYELDNSRKDEETSSRLLE